MIIKYIRVAFAFVRSSKNENRLVLRNYLVTINLWVMKIGEYLPKFNYRINIRIDSFIGEMHAAYSCNDVTRYKQLRMLTNLILNIWKKKKVLYSDILSKKQISSNLSGWHEKSRVSVILFLNTSWHYILRKMASPHYRIEKKL